MDGFQSYKEQCIELLERLSSDPESDPSELMAAYEQSLGSLRVALLAKENEALSGAKGASEDQKTPLEDPELVRLRVERTEANTALLELSARLMTVESSLDMMRGLGTL